VTVFEDGRPLFQQIADLLTEGIVAGRYPEDAQVPSTNELAGFYRINPATVGKGVNLLVEQGVLHKRRGLGMFVSPGARDRLVSMRTERFRDDYVSPLLREARQLGLSTPDIHRLIDQESEK
jgi:GntR family transcriptional regulator